MYNSVRKAVAVSALCVLMLTGCGKSTAPVRVMDNNMMIQITCQNADVTMKTLDDGFEFNTIEGKVRGDLLTGMEADMLNSRNFDSNSYKVISVGENNGFAFTNTSGKADAYVHVIRLNDSESYIQLVSENSENALLAVETSTVFNNIASVDSDAAELNE